MLTSIYTNIGDVMTKRSGSMRAPYSGTYMFMFSLTRYNATLSRQATLWLVHNNKRVASTRHNYRRYVKASDVTSAHVGSHAIVQLDTNDRVWLLLREESATESTKQMQITVHYEIRFSGFNLW